MGARPERPAHTRREATMIQHTAPNFGSDEQYADDPAYEAYMAELERQCRATYITGGHDPYGTDCGLDAGHSGPHRGDDPMGNEGQIEWTGGGSCAGDPLPVRNVRRI